ncbi:aminoglycoside phosphotransferase family protein [Mesorhizobium sp. CA15]|uniref:phosphotransferase family protein n=1 Tax=Mesorhizobium sp. CA15 TaxID=2876641 RepID=UPI001CD16564|nr:aminoglycoside phosphotransferase family protein [Mesorhizobium sp. CA15]MBZ9865620.1 aminoglycoside phosphotransferase family protein [Mesorhizobium sp. CA15]
MECRHAIIAAHPHLAGATFAIAGRGWHSLAVEVDGRLIFKFPQGEVAEAALLREARLLGAVRPFVMTPVPDMTIHSGPPLFSMHGKLSGRTLEPADYAKLGDTARARLAEDLALFFAELHAIDSSVMRAAGAEPVGWWDMQEDTLAPIWPLLPPELRRDAEAAIKEYHELGPDPLGEVYGFFDAHGWNMAFDHDRMRLTGIFDFADSGFGPPHREFVQVSLIDPDLALRSIRAYEARTGNLLDPRRVFLLAASMRLSELAGAVETGENVPMILDFAVDWLRQQAIR